jgi:2-dehydropantoate 2-reductase
MDAACIVGAGGIGCAVGHALCSAGWDVTFVDANAEKVRWGRANGVGIDGRGLRPASFISFDKWEPRAEHLSLLCTKSYDNEAVLRCLPSNATLLPIQNGFDHELESRNHFFEGIASFVSECLPGRTQTRITRQGSLHIGPVPEGTLSPEDERPVRALYEALSRCASFRVKWVPNVLPYKYTKLMYNAAISPLAAAAGLDNGQLLSVPAARRLFFALLRENYAILAGAGVSLAKIGLFHPATVNRILNCKVLASALAWAFYPSLRGSYCSMFGDLPAGRTEIDFYNGRLIELAGDRPCPLNRRVYDLVKRMEYHRIKPGLEALESLTGSRGANDPSCGATVASKPYG